MIRYIRIVTEDENGHPIQEHCHDVLESSQSRHALPSSFYITLGFAQAQICAMIDRGLDPRHVEISTLCREAEHALHGILQPSGEGAPVPARAQVAPDPDTDQSSGPG